LRFLYSSVKPRFVTQVAVAAILIAVCLLSVPAHATTPITYTVTTLVDTTDATPDCTSGTGNTCSLRDAITLGNANSGSTITFTSGLAGTIFLSASNHVIYISGNMTITGPGANQLTINLGTNGLFDISNVSLWISGLTLTDGDRALALQSNATASINSCVITQMGSGALLVDSGSSLTVTNSLIYGNTVEISYQGAGIDLEAGSVNVMNSTITGNNTTTKGGGIYNEAGTLTVTNSTITGNYAGSAGSGIYNNNGVVTITNSIVSGNVTPTTPDDCDDCGTQTSNNLIGGTPPTLGPLAWNGGPMKTMMPLIGSTAINAGSFVSGAQPVNDQRGFPRPTSGAFDLGAVQTHYLTVNTVADTNDGKCTATTCSFRDALEQAATDGQGDIRFSAKGTISLTLGKPLPAIAENLNIVGPGASQLTIDGTGSTAVGGLLSVSLQKIAAISGVTIANGNSPASATTSYSGSAITSYGELTISNSVLSGNTTASQYGTILQNGQWLLVDSSTISGNTASRGGAIYYLGQGAVIVNNSTLSGNTASGSGGGIYSYEGTVLVNNSTLSGNTANDGGSIYFDCPLTLSCEGVIANNSTISDNSVAAGATASGIYNTAYTNNTVTLYNSIVAGNLIGTTASGDCTNCGTQSKYNFIGGNPELLPLQVTRNGTAQATMIPQPGSPVMGAGSWILSHNGPDIMDPALRTDERGFPRTTSVLQTFDLGAVQTNYTGVYFNGQPGNSVVGQNMGNPPVVSVGETNTTNGNGDDVAGIPVTLTFSGGASEVANQSSLTLTTPANGQAVFDGIAINTAGTGYTFTVASPELGSTKVISDPFNVLAPAFTVGVTPAALTVTGGQSGTTTVSVTPQNGFNSLVTLTCSGLPTGATCIFAPASVTPSGTAASTKLTVTTAATTAELRRNPSPLIPTSTLAVAFCCLLGFKKRRNIQLMLLLAVSVIGLSLVTGCGGGSSTNTTTTKTTTPVTTTVTVTGTSGSGSSLLQSTTTFSLTVQ
jgi:hypothetical protein